MWNRRIGVLMAKFVLHGVFSWKWKNYCFLICNLFGPPALLNVFTNSAWSVCPSVCLSLRIGSLLFFGFLDEVRVQNIHKSDRADFLSKVLLFLKWGKWGIFGFKITVLKFSFYLFIRYFWNCSWWQALKSG